MCDSSLRSWKSFDALRAVTLPPHGASVALLTSRPGIVTVGIYPMNATMVLRRFLRPTVARDAPAFGLSDSGLVPRHGNSTPVETKRRHVDRSDELETPSHRRHLEGLLSR
jgi:hypothetical protein